MRLARFALCLAALAVFVAAAGCGESTPTQPTPQTPGTPSTPAPAATFSLTVDSLGSQEAIAGVSNVTVDASGSTGQGLRYEVAFGDGDKADTSVARHVYRTPGSYRVTVTVTDQGGRATTTERTLVVAQALGRWSHAGFLEKRRTVEVRTLVLTTQEGTTVRGTLTRFRNQAIPVSGTLTADRRITLTVEDGSETFHGTLPSVVSASELKLTAASGAISGETLTFSKVEEPAGAEPDAVLDIQFQAFEAPFAVKQITPIRFDAGRSRGEGLRHFIEFGDGQFVAAGSATRPVENAGSYASRVTVIDRYGRSDSETRAFEAWSLVTAGAYNQWEGGLVGAGGSSCYPVDVRFLTQNGSAVSGSIAITGSYDDTWRCQQGGRDQGFTGTVSADGSVQLRLVNVPVTLTGTMTLPGMSEHDHRLELKYGGGPLDGWTYRGYWRRGY